MTLVMFMALVFGAEASAKRLSRKKEGKNSRKSQKNKPPGNLPNCPAVRRLSGIDMAERVSRRLDWGDYDSFDHYCEFYPNIICQKCPRLLL